MADPPAPAASVEEIEASEQRLGFAQWLADWGGDRVQRPVPKDR